MNRRPALLLLAILTIPLSIFLHSCEEDGLVSIPNTITFQQRLSTYQVFDGDPSRLVPSPSFHLYELGSELFTDHAEKQRLIKIPDGTSVVPNGNGLPVFPDGTTLVKTFYYPNDGRDQSKGRKLIETRLMLKSGTTWNVATYLWNEEQTDAQLITTGMNKIINWIDDQGTPHVISYHIPSNRECSTCHQSNGTMLPIGPKLRNLNHAVTRNDIPVNQLFHFHSSGLLASNFDPTEIEVQPDWTDSSLPIDRRARAYLDINCAHCHNSNGNASDTNLHLDFETSYSNTGIASRKAAIIDRMENGTMPRLGTTVIHDEALMLIRTYINNL